MLILLIALASTTFQNILIFPETFHATIQQIQYLQIF